MHPAVDVANLRKLPASLRRVAMVAYGNNRSFQDLKRVQNLVDSASKSQKILFLPVFFVTLDPTRIPSAEELESFIRTLGAKIGPTLWPRVWSWVYFIYEHHEHLPVAYIRVHEEIYIQFLIYVAHIYGNPSISKYILNPALENCLYYLAGFMNVLDFDDPVQFTEIIDGAGGTLDDWHALSYGLYIRSLVRFIQGFSPKPTALRPQFMETLRHHKFVPPFVVAMATLLVTSELDTEESLRTSFKMLERLLNTPLGPRCLPEAIGAGLLRTIASCATEFAPGRLDDSLRYFLTKLLPDGLVYYHVVAAMPEALVHVADMSSNEEFEALEIFDDWIKFLDLAERRVKLKEDLDLLVSTKACDNIEVRVFLDLTIRFLTSPSAEKFNTGRSIVDWKNGGHRKNCGSYTMLSLAESASCALGFHERQFMRALVQNSYDEVIFSISQQQVKLIANNPGGSDPITLFNYTYNPVRKSVHSVADSPIVEAVKGLGSQSGQISLRGRPAVVDAFNCTSCKFLKAAAHAFGSLPADFDAEYITDEVGNVLDLTDSAELVEIH
ncbi:hypothetical protein B0H13DRAFT_2331012 [Mycena leptocephala]|nr:hypothetical protein B0H13DRAFT_2331012 [Mycena leptocephala]